MRVSRTGGTFLLVLALGCGGSSSAPTLDASNLILIDAGGDGGGMHVVPPIGDAGVSHDAPIIDGSVIGASDAGYPAAFATPPKVTNAGGGVLKTPKLVAVFFQNDDATSISTYGQFYTDLGGSAWWGALAEYGIGAPTVVKITLPVTAPTALDDTANEQGSNTQLETYLLEQITSGALPATDDNTEYVLNFPSGTSITQDGSTACTPGSFDGYHSDMTDDSNHLIAYAVVPRCPAQGGLDVAQTLTSTASHEVIEAATDPWPDYEPGWAQDDNSHLFWDEANDGSEIGDMCENDPEAYYQFSDLPFVVQRFWSNAAATAGHDPCVPALPGETFFAAVPEPPTTVAFPYYGNTVQVDAVNIAVGSSATVLLNLYSDKATTRGASRSSTTTICSPGRRRPTPSSPSPCLSPLGKTATSFR